MQSVTVLHAEFRTELVVNLYSGWIAQLADASFPGTLIFALGATISAPPIATHGLIWGFWRLVCSDAGSFLQGSKDDFKF